MINLFKSLFHKQKQTTSTSNGSKQSKMPIFIGISFGLYISGFFVFHLATSDLDFSELENRNLMTLPTLQMATLLDGSFEKDFETYAADQFPLRNTFISLKAGSEYLLQRKENNGVYIGKDHYFLQDFKSPDLELAKKNASYINDIASDFNVYLALAPTATKVLEDKLPSFAAPYDEGLYIQTVYNDLSDKVHKVPLLETLTAHHDEAIYYKTDHHWTSLGAYYGYTAFCKSAGIVPLPLNDFNIETVSDSFYGSLFSKGNFTYAKPDQLQIFYPIVPHDVTVTYEATGVTTNSLYNYDHLKTKDKYSVFLDNNHALIKIKTDVKNGRKLMVVKDSYANSFVPFLTLNYEEIHILDLRLLTMPLKSYASQNDIDDILLLYNVQNFAVEGKLSLLRQ